MWKFRIETKKEFRGKFSTDINKHKGKTFDTEKEAKQALKELPEGFEIVSFMRSGIAI